MVPAAEQHAELLEWKGRIARGLLASRAWLRRRLTGSVVESQERLHRLTRDLESVHGAAPAAGPGRNAARIAEILRERSELEREMLGEPGDRSVSVRPSPLALAAAIAEDEVLIDFVVYRQILVPVSELENPDRGRGDRVVAFVLRCGASPVRVNLGPLSPIADAAEAHLRLVARRRTPAGPAGSTAADAAAGRLAGLIWKPLAAAVGECRRVIICPDGVLALIPFETLPGRNAGRYLIEEREFIYVPAAEDVLRPETGPRAEPGLLLVGDPEFAGGSVAAGVQRGGGPFPPLPGTGAEVAAIAALADEAGFAAGSVRVVTGKEATEAAVKRLAPGRSHVHVATHGWSDAVPVRVPQHRAGTTDGPFVPDAGSLAPREVLAGLRSGLALAGAGAGAPGNPGAAGSAEAGSAGAGPADDGLLTAEEIGWLDLGGCDLVVLSACESGLGQPFAGEHLLGVRRSLRLAGARASVTTLWKVPDDAALALMRGFYERLWVRKLPVPAALHAARLAMLDLNRKRPGGDPLPGTWGAFIYDGPAR